MSSPYSATPPEPAGNSRPFSKKLKTRRLFGEWQIEALKQCFGLGIGLRACDEDDVHAADRIDLVIDDLRENNLFLEAHGEVAAAVEALVVRDAAEIADPRHCDGHQTVEKLVHL